MPDPVCFAADKAKFETYLQAEGIRYEFQRQTVKTYQVPLSKRNDIAAGLLKIADGCLAAMILQLIRQPD